MPSQGEYQLACDRAAHRQGLTPMMRRLEEEKIPFELLQTGGWNMVITVPIGETLTLGVTCEDGEWLVAEWMTEEQYKLADYEENIFVEAAALEEVIDKLRELLLEVHPVKLIVELTVDGETALEFERTSPYTADRLASVLYRKISGGEYEVQ